MKLSVALCTYNGARFIEKQLLSILQQDLPISEIVVSDDGSKDATMDIVNHLAQEHPKVLWTIRQTQSNVGVIKNFEKAISLCTGDIIFLADQDDLWRKDKTQKIVTFFDSYPEKDVVFTDADLINADGNLVTHHSLLEAWQLLPCIDLWEAGFSMEIMMFCNRATGATIAFKRNCREKFLPFGQDSQYLHDYQIAMYACINNSLGLIKERLIQYRQHGANVQGVAKDNWVYETNLSQPQLLLEAIEPVPLRPFCRKYHSARLDFYQTRTDAYSTLKGKFRLLTKISQYKLFYGRLWKLFLTSDLFYGISANLRKKLINHLISKK